MVFTRKGSLAFKLQFKDQTVQKDVTSVLNLVTALLAMKVSFWGQENANQCVLQANSQFKPAATHVIPTVWPVKPKTNAQFVPKTKCYYLVSVLTNVRLVINN